ncbi:MAG: STAS domain-containing protein [Gammaproteobacteria bacterium]|nr:STAS domain-containing protein [Gammaproteobacteria bacterium]
MTGATLERDEGRFRLRGALSFASVPGLLAQRERLFESAPGFVEIDLSGVSRSDSAGLALLVDWMREAQRRTVDIRYLNMPQQMLAIARVSSLDGILPLERD